MAFFLAASFAATRRRVLLITEALIRDGLRDEAHRWLQMLGAPREVRSVELSGMIASIAHLAYHLGAMRQIATNARGPREGTFA